MLKHVNSHLLCLKNATHESRKANALEGERQQHQCVYSCIKDDLLTEQMYVLAFLFLVWYACSV
jgi:hypothetical protein